MNDELTISEETSHRARLISERKQRAMTERIALIQRQRVDNNYYLFAIKGSRNANYFIEIVNKRISLRIKCSCPDYFEPCKHIIFLLCKILGYLTKDVIIHHVTKIIGQERDGLLARLEHFMELMDQNVTVMPPSLLDSINYSSNNNDDVIVAPTNNEKRKSDAIADIDKTKINNKTKENTLIERRNITDDDTCAICFDNMDITKEILVYCKAQCGHNFHEDCINDWLAYSLNSQTCPRCRSKWES